MNEATGSIRSWQRLAGKTRSFLATFVPVALLSALIWFYADRISSKTGVEKLMLRVTAARNSDLLVQLVEPNPGENRVELEVTFSGPSGELELLRREIVGGRFAPEYVVKKDSLAPLVLDTREAVTSAMPRRFAAIAVAEASPAEIKVAVDKMITVPLPVRVLRGSIQTTDPAVTPATVNVELPRSAFESVRADERVVTVDIEERLRNRPEDQVIDEKFPIPQQPLGGHPIATEPDHVRVQLQFQKQYVTKEFKFARVQVRGPVDLLNAYDVSITLPNQQIAVVFRGPIDQIESLKPEDIVPYIILDEEDRTRTSTPFPREVRFSLPERARNVIVEEQPHVDFQLVEKEAAEAAIPVPAR